MLRIFAAAIRTLETVRLLYLIIRARVWKRPIQLYYCEWFQICPCGCNRLKMRQMFIPARDAIEAALICPGRPERAVLTHEQVAPHIEAGIRRLAEDATADEPTHDDGPVIH